MRRTPWGHFSFCFTDEETEVPCFRKDWEKAMNKWRLFNPGTSDRTQFFHYSWAKPLELEPLDSHPGSLPLSHRSELSSVHLRMQLLNATCFLDPSLNQNRSCSKTQRCCLQQQKPPAWMWCKIGCLPCSWADSHLPLLPLPEQLFCVVPWGAQWCSR